MELYFGNFRIVYEVTNVQAGRQVGRQAGRLLTGLQLMVRPVSQVSLQARLPDGDQKPVLL